MHIHVLGYPVAVAIVLGAGAFALRGYRRMAGLVHLLIFGALFCATIGVTVWLDALAGLVSSGVGTLVLLVLLLLSGAGFTFEVILRHMHHQVRTPVISGVFAITLALALGESARLLSRAARSPGKTASALGTAMGRIRSGQAAAAVAPHQRIVVLVIGIAVLAAFFYGLHHVGTRLKGTPRIARGKGGSRPGPLALPPGQSHGTSLAKR